MRSKSIQEADFLSIIRTLQSEKKLAPLSSPGEKEAEIDPLALKTRLETKRELFELMHKGGYLTPDRAQNIRASIDQKISELDQILASLDEETLS